MFDAQLVVQVALYVAFGVVGLLAYLSPGVAQAHRDSSGQSGRMSPARSLCFFYPQNRNICNIRNNPGNVFSVPDSV